eukprot:1807522-Pleurochrysis_carterae.AAC.1
MTDSSDKEREQSRLLPLHPKRGTLELAQERVVSAQSSVSIIIMVPRLQMSSELRPAASSRLGWRHWHSSDAGGGGGSGALLCRPG